MIKRKSVFDRYSVLSILKKNPGPYLLAEFKSIDNELKQESLNKKLKKLKNF